MMSLLFFCTKTEQGYKRKNKTSCQTCWKKKHFKFKEKFTDLRLFSFWPWKFKKLVYFSSKKEPCRYTLRKILFRVAFKKRRSGYLWCRRNVNGGVNLLYEWWQSRHIFKGYISPSIFACHFMSIGVGTECKRLQPKFIHSAIMPTSFW